MRINKVGFILLPIMFICGCGLHLYRPANHENAKKAQAAFEDAKVSEVISEERNNLAELKKYEHEVVKRNVMARRDSQLNEILRADNWGKTLAAKLNKRAEYIIDGSMTDAIYLDLKGDEEQMASDEATYELLRQEGDPDLTCPVEDFSDYNKESPAYSTAESYNEVCKSYMEKKEKIENYSKGALGKLNNDIEELDKVKVALKKEIKAKLGEYNAEKEAYKKIAKKEASSFATYTSSLNVMSGKLAKFGNISSYAAKVPDKFKENFSGYNSEVKVRELQEKISSVESILDALQKEDPSNLKGTGDKEVFLCVDTAARLINLSGDVADEFRKKDLNAVLLVLNNLKLELDLEKRKLSHAEKRYKLLTSKRAAYMEELKFLISSYSQLGAGTIADDKRLYAILQYANSWTNGRFIEEQLDYELIDDTHEEALDNSEVAQLQWVNMIYIPLQRLTQFHGSGITQETIATLLSATAIAATIGAK